MASANAAAAAEKAASPEKPSRAEMVARNLAEAYLATVETDCLKYLEKAKTAPNSGLLLMFQDGVRLIGTDGAAAATEPSTKATRTESQPAAATTTTAAAVARPDKVAYMPVGVIDEMLGREVPAFTYSKLRDLVVVVVLCGVDEAGAKRDDGFYSATFVYPVVTDGASENVDAASKEALDAEVTK